MMQHCAETDADESHERETNAKVVELLEDSGERVRIQRVDQGTDAELGHTKNQHGGCNVLGGLTSEKQELLDDELRETLLGNLSSHGHWSHGEEQRPDKLIVEERASELAVAPDYDIKQDACTYEQVEAIRNHFLTRVYP